MGYKSSSGEQALVDFGNKCAGRHPLSGASVENPQPTEGNWVGREKTRYNFVLKYLSGHATNRGYYVHSFQDKSGNRFLSFLDCETITIPIHQTLLIGQKTIGLLEDHRISAGDCFSCKATVIRHSINTFEYETTGAFKETVLNRIYFKAFIGRKDTMDGETVDDK